MTGGPAALAGRLLFEPYADQLRASGAYLPSREALDQSLDACGARPCLADGTPIRLIASAHAEGYEAGIARTGGVPTRSDDWHDYFNALVWWRFPRAKAALNAAHLAEIDSRAQGAPRGRRRDALTQFDECGVVVSASDPALLDCLRQHDWRGLFWDARAAWGHRISVTVFGHASLDQLRAPFLGLCGKALLWEVSPAWFASEPALRWRELDAWLADCIGRQDVFGAPRDLRPLPFLGVPGLVAANAAADYYDDTRQFRPLRVRPPATL
ncbi:DUF3025 domain-containing protein [Niveibacterium sp. 24ML]|uniref:DUF3025 domain-containing protein n=1 Tax=Niveibacterium sp. 24ML TaxID=2985512 RepID=UPI002272058B|nr:DUF3025 domain-containing protein [Niveibacterium sp. 24ML]MCX9157895.1 DUF3025 domain-containing protein [Niveibacterium sp. 24ML]